MNDLNSTMISFCDLVAQGYEPDEACFRAGYGLPKHSTCDHYHAKQSRRLLARPEIQRKIEEFREFYKSDNQQDRINKLEEFLWAAFMNDPTKYSEIVQYRTDKSIRQQVVIKKDYLNFEDWSLTTRQMIDRIDPKTGNPIFIDKKWVIDRLMKIYQLGENKDNNQSKIEDFIYALQAAGMNSNINKERTVVNVSSDCEVGTLPIELNEDTDFGSISTN